MTRERGRKSERRRVEQRETGAKREEESQREDPEVEAAAEEEDEGGEKEGRLDGERVTNESPSAKRELIQRTALPPTTFIHPAPSTDTAALSLSP